MIVPIGDWVLSEACREAIKWPRHIGVAVNVSPAQLNSRPLPLRVADVLAKSGLSPERLELEITETVLLHGGDDNLHTLLDLRQLGVKIALDDFGTGYSSLSYLQRFPFDKIKIDRSFVSDIIERREAKAVVPAVIGLGHALNMRFDRDRQQRRPCGGPRRPDHLAGGQRPRREFVQWDIHLEPTPGVDTGGSGRPRNTHQFNGSQSDQRQPFQHPPPYRTTASPKRELEQQEGRRLQRA